MLYAFGFERVGVVVSDLYFVNPAPAPGQEGPERGVRLEVRLLTRGEPQGGLYSAWPIVVDRPVWRADLLETADGRPGTFDRTHHHPEFQGWDPGPRHFDERLSAEPLDWVGARLGDLRRLLADAGIAEEEIDPADAAALTAALLAAEGWFEPAVARVVGSGARIYGKPGHVPGRDCMDVTVIQGRNGQRLLLSATVPESQGGCPALESLAANVLRVLTA